MYDLAVGRGAVEELRSFRDDTARPGVDVHGDLALAWHRIGHGNRDP